MYTIKDSWGNIVPVCGNHGEEHIEMTINSGPHSLFYSCPKYYPANRKPNERACNNRINLIEYERMVTHIHELIGKAQASGGHIDLKNHAWTQKGIRYKVLEHNGEKIVVEILNFKAMKS